MKSNRSYLIADAIQDLITSVMPEWQLNDPEAVWSRVADDDGSETFRIHTNDQVYTIKISLEG